MTLEEAMERWHVMSRSEYTNDMGWYWPRSFEYGVVSDLEGGVIALFTTERAALQHRLFLINEHLNGKKGEKQ